ncbi:hypothetical protein Tco_0726865 [Tanacetum coccineum]|uniref:Retrovirus-related Pol polyprotein from transposon TNT 1-94 n=1 Tax=Tanacetum coccineum TaxID=301880 RepID=A0ABQ4YGS2_9ASTR
MGLWYSKDSGIELLHQSDAILMQGVMMSTRTLEAYISGDKLHLDDDATARLWILLPTLQCMEHTEKCTIELYFVGTEYQLADLFTKALPRERFEYLVHRIGMRCMTPTELDRLAKLSS